MLPRYPYCNFHQLNLDWIISKIRELDDGIYAMVDAYIHQVIGQLYISTVYKEAQKAIVIEVTYD